MITLPDEALLLSYVQDALDVVAERAIKVGLSNSEWFPVIASEIAVRVRPLGLMSYARGKPEHCDGTEWLFDFCALIPDLAIPEADRFMAQAAIVGEVEWDKRDDEIDKDFEKLLIADSLVCFMVFQLDDSETIRRKLAWLGEAAKRRRQYARVRGLARPPAFLLSCYDLSAREPERRFDHTILAG